MPLPEIATHRSTGVIVACISCGDPVLLVARTGLVGAAGCCEVCGTTMRLAGGLLRVGNETPPGRTDGD